MSVKWEYMRVKMSETESGPIMESMQEYGEDGWECYAILVDVWGDKYAHMYHFKRIKELESQEAGA